MNVELVTPNGALPDRGVRDVVVRVSTVIRRRRSIFQG
jgi:hypothetical protein